MKEQRTKELNAHICPLCRASHMNNLEFMKVCPNCLRKHEIDLGFAEVLQEQENFGKFVSDRVDQLIELIQIHDKHYKRWKRSMYLSKAWAVIMVGLSIYYIIIYFATH